MMTTALTHDRMAKLAPAIFATAPHHKLSDRYAFLRTIDVLDALGAEGWVPVHAAQGRARDVTREGVQRHMVRLRHRATIDTMAMTTVGDALPEIVLTNSHDGLSAYQLHAGLFRLVCSNGMVVADATFEHASIRHSHVTTQEVIEASYRVTEEIPRLAASVAAMRQLQLTAGERQAFAQSAAVARWGEEAPADASALLTRRRYADGGDDLWTTFNRVQENLIRGGVRTRDAIGRRNRAVRAIGSVSEDIRLNKALWQLADSMRQLKTGDVTP